jgi:hypothetical protein
MSSKQTGKISICHSTTTKTSVTLKDEKFQVYFLVFFAEEQMHDEKQSHGQCAFISI